MPVRKANTARRHRDSTAAADVPPLNQYVCERVRAMRKKRGWSLERLATDSGVSRSMLSQIERGEANPTLAVAYRIARAFGMRLGELVDVPEKVSRIEIVRAEDIRCLFRDDENCRIRTLSPLHLEKDVEFYELRLKPGGALTSDPHFAGTREFLTIEKGAVRLTSGDDTCDLSAGDSAQYAADVPHRIENIARGETIGFLVDIYPHHVAR